MAKHAKVNGFDQSDWLPKGTHGYLCLIRPQDIPDIYGGYQKILSEVRPRLAEMMNANSDVAPWLQEDCNQFLFSSFPPIIFWGPQTTLHMEPERRMAEADLWTCGL